MARKHTCTDCHQPIPTGEAVLRSVSLELHAWHRGCFTGEALVRSSRPTLAESTCDDSESVLAGLAVAAHPTR